jgi:hypothetical protein
MSGHWIWGVTNSAWTNESAIINGRRIYSFRGGASVGLDYYDIAANTWVSAVTYAPATETFTTGTKYSYYGDNIYIHKDQTSRWFKYDIAGQAMDGWNTMPIIQGSAIVGDTAFDLEYQDGATVIVYVYMLLNTSVQMYRQMAI